MMRKPIFAADGLSLTIHGQADFFKEFLARMLQSEAGARVRNYNSGIQMPP
jgi:hypothetical protein